MKKLKEYIMKILSEGYKYNHNVSWKKDFFPHIGIECSPGFTADSWIQILDSEFSNWRDSAEIYFINNRFERFILSTKMDIYIGPWVTPDLFKSAPGLKWIQLLSAGVEFLEDIDIPSELKITTASGISSQGVAEHTIGLMIALDRRFDRAFIQQRRWVWKQDGILENIKGLPRRTIGLVGLGNVGRSIAILAKNMGMKVIGLSRQHYPIHELDEWYSFNELPRLLEQADFLVLCVPLTKETRGMIGRKELETMNRDSYLINVARGELIDENALAWALKKGIIAGAALDVLSSEPPPRCHPLKKCPNLIITPHVAGNIYTYRVEIKKRFIRNLKAFLNGTPMEGLFT